MSSSQRIDYFVKVSNLLSKYSLAEMLQGIPMDNINCLIIENKEVLLECNTYEKAIAYATKVLTSVIGFKLNINDFISSEVDRKELYLLLSSWRDSVLAPKV